MGYYIDSTMRKGTVLGYNREQIQDYARAAPAATGKQQGGEPEIEFQARLMDVKTDLPTENWRHSPTYDENPGRGTHYW
ncbi:hypothetical protein, partial [Pseudomonas viridiflava]|uniref:hypothetical protein n=1 Tax=Pseudomonas viridiflava TaxID=33069 RepID=UPI0013CED887